MENYMLTTKDNPHNPWTDFVSWFIYDSTHGYNTCGLIDRYAKTSNAFTEDENNEIIEQAIADIIENDLSDQYVRVSENNFDEFLEKYHSNKNIKESKEKDEE